MQVFYSNMSTDNVKLSQQHQDADTAASNQPLLILMHFVMKILFQED